MLKIVRNGAFILFIFIAGCSGISKYDDNEIAAIVKGEEITIGDLRFLYPDDTALDYLDWAIQVELVKQEVEEMDLDITGNLSEDWFGELPPKDTKDEGGKQIRKYAKSQAKKLDMKHEDFQQEYAKRINEQNAYITTYLKEIIGEAEPNEKRMTVLLDELMEENKDKIEVVIGN